MCIHKHSSRVISKKKLEAQNKIKLSKKVLIINVKTMPIALEFNLQISYLIKGVKQQKKIILV
jgi:hypothetical protein